MIIYEFLAADRGALSVWFQPLPAGLEKRQRTFLREKLDRLQAVNTHEDARVFIFPAKDNRKVVRDIFKIKVHGNVQLRPLLCFGPFQATTLEVTFLVRAKEIGDKWIPPGAPSSAALRRKALVESKAARCVFNVPPA